MATQIDQGPATNNAVIKTTADGDNGIEVHVPVATDSLSPAFAPYIDVQGATSAQGSPVNKAVAGIQFTVPA